jgi:hypothetical protein
LLPDNSDIAPIHPIAAGKKRSRWRLVVAALILVLLAWQILFRPLPRPVLYFIAEHAGGWLINQQNDRYAGASGFVKRLVSLKMEQSVIAHLHDRKIQIADVDDVALLRGRLAQIKPMLANQIDVPHETILSSSMLTGLGRCTGVNAAATLLLAHDFSRVDMIAVDGDSPDNGHSFGRAWSQQRKQWLYFDIWSPQIQIFTATPAGATYLLREPSVLSAADSLAAQRTKPMHDMAYGGHVRAQIQTSFGGYIWYRMNNFIDHGSTWEIDNRPATQLLTHPLPIEPELDVSNSWSASPNTYLTARLDQIFGDDASARQRYLRVNKTAKTNPSAFDAAASVFAGRLVTPIKQQEAN